MCFFSSFSQLLLTSLPDDSTTTTSPLSQQTFSPGHRIFPSCEHFFFFFFFKCGVILKIVPDLDHWYLITSQTNVNRVIFQIFLLLSLSFSSFSSCLHLTSFLSMQNGCLTYLHWLLGCVPDKWEWMLLSHRKNMTPIIGNSIWCPTNSNASCILFRALGYQIQLTQVTASDFYGLSHLEELWVNNLIRSFLQKNLCSFLL